MKFTNVEIDAALGKAKIKHEIERAHFVAQTGAFRNSH